MNYPEYLKDAKDFALAIFQCFNKENGYTDIYVQPERQLKARRGGDAWELLDFPQIEGLGVVPEAMVEKYANRGNSPVPFVIGTKQFHNILTTFFDNPDWPKLVSDAGGCLYPVFSVDDQSGPGDEEDLESVDLEQTVDDNLLYRLRITLQKQDMGKFGMMMRCLRPVNRSLQELGLPLNLESMLKSRSGLILITGATGAGKSTTMAGIIDLFNETRNANIVLIEDPVEFLHSPKRSSITYREVGTDIDTFAEGVNQVLRFVPDVIGIGEIREPNTMQAALRAAESGHLVLGTIHAPTTFNAIRKALSFLETNGEKLSFGSSLVGVIAQTLQPRFGSDGVSIDGKALAYEILDLTGNKALLAASVERMVSSQSMGDELASLEKTFIEKPSSLGVAGSPYSDRIGELVRKGLIDHRYVLSLCDASSRASIEAAGVEHLRRREALQQQSHASANATLAAPEPVQVQAPPPQIAPAATPVDAIKPAAQAVPAGFVQPAEQKRGGLGRFFGGGKE